MHNLDLRTIGLVAAGAAFWLFYFDFKDRLSPEPKHHLLFAAALGMVTAFLALGAYVLLEAFGVSTDPVGSPQHLLTLSLGVIGPIEEGSKVLVFLLVVRRWKVYDEPLDAVVYASAIGIGFAATENLFYLPNLERPEQIARAVTSPLTHSLFAAVWGYGIGRAQFLERSRRRAVMAFSVAFLASVLLHGVYDFFLFAWDAPHYTAGLIFLIWIGLLFRIRQLARHKR